MVGPITIRLIFNFGNRGTRRASVADGKQIVYMHIENNMERAEMVFVFRFFISYAICLFSRIMVWEGQWTA